MSLPQQNVKTSSYNNTTQSNGVINVGSKRIVIAVDNDQGFRGIPFLYKGYAYIAFSSFDGLTPKAGENVSGTYYYFDL